MISINFVDKLWIPLISWTRCSASSAVYVHFFRGIQKSFPRTTTRTTTTNKPFLRPRQRSLAIKNYVSYQPNLVISIQRGTEFHTTLSSMHDLILVHFWDDQQLVKAWNFGDTPYCDAFVPLVCCNHFLSLRNISMMSTWKKLLDFIHDKVSNLSFFLFLFIY